MAKTIQFKIVTPEGIAYESDVNSLTVPTTDGEITVLPEHIPLVALCMAGEVTVKKDGESSHFATARGVLEIRPGSEAVLLSDAVLRAEDIDLAEAEAARGRAEEMLREKENLSDIEFGRVQAVLDRELARIKVRTKHYRQ